MQLDRRKLLIGGGAGVGLIVAWALWPRKYRDNMPVEKGEHSFGSWLKIAEDGTVTIAIPQAEMGQGSYTALAQIVAGELGADWNKVAIQPALASPVFANTLFLREWRPAFLAPSLQNAQGELPDSTGDEWARRNAFMITAGSTSIRQFEQPCRIAGATARALLSMAAAKNWDADWQKCGAENGFVTLGKMRAPFADLAAAAAAYSPPGLPPLRTDPANAISGKEMARLDVASKVDGSANFAGDVRLPDMLFASVRAGPIGDTRLKKLEAKAAKSVPGFKQLVETDRWFAGIASNWWAANQVLDRVAPLFETKGRMPDTAAIGAELDRALKKDAGTVLVENGSVAATMAKAAGTRIYRAIYEVAPALHASLETRSAAAQYRDGTLTLWLASQAPEAARQAAAKGAGISVNDVVLIQTMGGGSFGRNLDSDIAEQAAHIARKVGKPVHVSWSRPEDFVRDAVRPPAQARMVASLGDDGLIQGMAMHIAVPATAREAIRRIKGESAAEALAGVKGEYDILAVEGAVPPYSIPNLKIVHHPVSLALPTGLWRGNAHSYNAFFVEAFVDELAKAAGVEPLSYRMQMLSGQTRLAKCLTGVAKLSGWDGGAGGSGRGIACHQMAGSHIAVVATARTDENGVRVDRISAVVDCGRLINPELARQQIEGGIIFGLSQALGSSTDYEKGLPTARRLQDLDLPKMADIPEIEVEFVRSDEAPGGVSELAVPPVAPAIANALFSAAGMRLRELPLLSA